MATILCPLCNYFPDSGSHNVFDYFTTVELFK